MFSTLYPTFIISKLRKENEILKSHIIKILESKKEMNLYEYELYLSICDSNNLTTKKIYPKLPESDEE